MKNTIKGIIIGVVLTSVIGVSAAYVYTARDIGYSPSDENWNVTNAGEAISSLKTDVNSLNEYRSDIVESLVDKGVDVNENSSMADIKNGIDNMSNEMKFQVQGYIGGGTTAGAESYITNTNYKHLHVKVISYSGISSGSVKLDSQTTNITLSATYDQIFDIENVTNITVNSRGSKVEITLY